MLESIRKNKFLLLTFVVMFFVGRKIWFMDFPITNFENLTLGMATAKNIDISKLIGWYIFYAIPLCLLFAWLFNKSELYFKAKNFFSKITFHKDETKTFLAVIALAFIILGKHNLSAYVYAICLGLILFFGREKEKAAAAWLATIYIFIAPISYVAQFFGHVDNLVLTFVVVAAIFFSAQKNISLWFARLYPFLIASIAELILLNLLEILAVRGHALGDTILILPYVCAVISLFFFKPPEEKDYCKKILRGSLILIIFSYSLNVAGLNYIFNLNFFEGANSGLSISEFIRGQGLPVIDNFDAHMLSATLPGIIYFLLTGDSTGAVVFTPYNHFIWNALAIPGFFWLLRKFFSECQSFIILTIFPFGQIFSYHFGIVTLLAFWFWKNNPSFLKSLAVQVLISIICLLRIDLGVQWGFALFLSPILVCLFRRDYKNLRQYIFAAVLYVSLFFCVVFFVLDFKFAEEFLTAFNSNQHWAYGALGKFLRVFLFYLVTPIVISILIFPTFQRLFERREMEFDWIFLFLYAVFFFGLNRILVRYTLIHVTIFNIRAFMPEFFLLALLIVSLCKRHKATVFVLVFSFFVLACTHVNITSTISSVNNIPKIVRSVHTNQDKIFKNFTKEDAAQMAESKKFFDANLRGDETYFDFTNQTLFYVFNERKNPLYINQHPGMINGVKGQIQALEQLKKSKIKFVVMPYLQRKAQLYDAYTQIDGILNCDRYYLLTEWIAKNYQPYRKVGNFFVWVEKNSAPSKNLNYTYEPEKNHIHELGYIPFLWGKNSAQARKIEISQKNNDSWSLENVSGKIGFITLKISAAYNSDAKILIKGKGINDIVYKFNIKEGTHNYRLRASSDILWHSNLVRTLKTQDVAVEEIYFEEVEE